MRGFRSPLSSLTIQSLDAFHVICMQPEVGTVTSVNRRHQSTLELGVTQAQSVAYFMGRYNTQICPVVRSFCPELVLVKMDDTRIWWFSVSQNLTCREKTHSEFKREMIT